MTDQINPWQQKNSKLVYDNAWISVHHDEVITPNGTEGIYGKVAFKNKAIGIIPLDEHNNTWLVGQYRYTLDEYSWEIPMGGGPLGEETLTAAKRELKEETGIEAEEWECILRLHTSNSVTDEEGFIYVARVLSYGKTSFDNTEDLRINKLPLQEVIKMINEGQITDAITIAGILKLNASLCRSVQIISLLIIFLELPYVLGKYVLH